MLRETKVGLLVASCFLGLVGTVFFLKYSGDPLAASMAPANVAEPSFLDEPIPSVPEHVPPASQPVAVPPAVPANPTQVATTAPAGSTLENIGSGQGLRLVSTTGDPKLSGEPSGNPATPQSAESQPVERRTVPPQPEQSPAANPSPGAGEFVGPPAPPDLNSVANDERSPRTAPESPTSSGQPSPSPSDGPLAMPPPDAVLGHTDTPPKHPDKHSPPGSVPVSPTPGAPEAGALASSAGGPATTDPPARPAATLGSPQTNAGSPAIPPIGGMTPPPANGPDHRPPAGAGIIPGALAASGPAPGAAPPIPPSGHSAAVVNPPMNVPAPVAPLPVVPSVVSFDEETYPCKAGDTFAAVAQQYYHSDKYERALLMFNRDHPLASPSIRNDPPVFQPGQPIYIPQVKVLESRYPTLIPGLTPLPQGAVAVATPPAPPRPYQVAAPTGEMMRDIAGRSLGNPERWVDIYRMNPNFDPARPVPAGTTLQLPADAK